MPKNVSKVPKLVRLSETLDIISTGITSLQGDHHFYGDNESTGGLV